MNPKEQHEKWEELINEMMERAPDELLKETEAVLISGNELTVSTYTQLGSNNPEQHIDQIKLDPTEYMGEEE